MSRAILIVLDSVGCGGAEDAKAYGDEGADTLGHIAEACARGLGDREGLRRGPLKVPRLAALGLGHAMRASTGRAPPGFARAEPRGQWGYGVETSRGKDTPSGHWEIAGTPVNFDWGYFPLTRPAASARSSKLPASGGMEKSLRCEVRKKSLAVAPTKGRAMTRPMLRGSTSFRAMRQRS